MIQAPHSATELKDQARRFRALHSASETFVMPCAWDPVSSKIFESLGFACIGTTSGGVNWLAGRQDYVYEVSREQMLDAYGEVARATSLPVSGDLENGYGDSEEDVKATILGSVAQGMVGGSIEDQVMDGSGQLYAIDVAEARIRTAREAADSTGIEYTLTARCEVCYSGVDEPYAEAVDRLNRYHDAGADCLFVPGINDIESLSRLVRDVAGPISFGMGASEKSLTLDQLADVGVRRVSTGGGLARVAIKSVLDAASDIINTGKFDYVADAISESELNKIL